MLLIGYELNVSINYLKQKKEDNQLGEIINNPQLVKSNWAPLEPFELLGDEFVKDMVGNPKRLSRFALPLSEALEAYTVLKNTRSFCAGT